MAFALYVAKTGIIYKKGHYIFVLAYINEGIQTMMMDVDAFEHMYL